MRSPEGNALKKNYNNMKKSRKRIENIEEKGEVKIS